MSVIQLVLRLIASTWGKEESGLMSVIRLLLRLIPFRLVKDESGLMSVSDSSLSSIPGVPYVVNFNVWLARSHCEVRA